MQDDQNGPYRYKNSRPLPVFGLALLASLGALLLISGAYLFLTDATDDNIIPEPPNLKNTVTRVADKAEATFSSHPVKTTDNPAPEGSARSVER